MGDVWRVSLNEWVKLLRRKRLWVTAILALLIVMLFAYGSYRDAQSKSNFNSPAYTERQIQGLQQTINQMKSQPKTPQTTQNLQQLQSQLGLLKQQYAVQQGEMAGNWKPVVQKQINSLNKQLKSLGSTRADQVTAAKAKLQLMQLNYEVQHNVKPLVPWKASAYDSLYNFFDAVASIFLPLLIVIMTADIVAGESTSGTIKLLLIRPVSRTKILLGKWIVTLFATALLTLATCFALLGSGIGAVGGQGALQPKVVGMTYKFIPQTGVGTMARNGLEAVPQLGTASVLPAWLFTIDAILLTTLAMLVVATIAFLCSVLFKSAMASTAVAMGVVIIGNIAMNLVHSKWLLLWFPVHQNLAADWTGVVSQRLQMNVGLGIGLLVLAGWVVVALAVSIYKFKKQDILNA